MHTCLEICAGIGGLAIGVREAGFEHIAMYERDARCCNVLRANGFSVEEADITEVDFKRFRGKVTLVCGGVPCQPFSMAGLSKGNCDPRNLFDEAVRCVRECMPNAFLFENVSGLLRPCFNEYLQQLKGQFEELGFEFFVEKCDASLFGCAQRRRRCMLVGVRSGIDYVTPKPTTPTRPTVRSVIDELGPPDNRNGHTLHHRTPRIYRNHGPSRLDAPAKTVLSGPNGPGGGNNMLQMDDGTLRYFTLRELARLQGFPDEHKLDTVWTHACKQLGNAAPPPLVFAFASAIRLSFEQGF